MGKIENCEAKPIGRDGRPRELQSEERISRAPLADPLPEKMNRRAAFKALIPATGKALTGILRQLNFKEK